MLRADALGAIYPELEDRIVVTIMGAVAAELYTLGHRPGFFYLEHAMGLASSLGLGIALALPRHKVVVIDGDGSLLMNLGSLATIGLLRPRNYVLVVMDNEQFATTGGQQTPTARGADLEAAARAMQVASAVTVRTADALANALAAGAQAGPAVIVAKVAESAPTARPPLDGVALKQRFMSALGEVES
jgi:sulfopyruvate decarboxylase subunit beta